MAAEDKGVVRQRMIQLRKAAPLEARREWSRAICDRVCASEAYAHATNVVSYLPVGAEVDPHDAAEAARRSGRTRYYTDSGAELTLRPAEPGVPAASRMERLDDPRTLFLVPGVAFDESGGRLGRGGGWYDRLLPRFMRASRWGLAFALQMVPRLPLDPWDVTMDGIITERACIHTRRPPYSPEGTV
jgi:5-formyltetrahydrofolate cyclo-ligase